MALAEKSKILIFGGTGYIGKFMVKASIFLGHPTYVYARPITPQTTPSKMDLHKDFQSMGVTIVQRFLPSDFGCEEDRVTPLLPFQDFLDKKKKIRRVIEEIGIPYTFVSANCFGAYFVNILLRPHEKQDDIVVYGSGKAKAVLNYEEDVALYTIKVANDPRTCNHIVIYRPPKNIVSQLELISLWEKKTNRSFNRVYVPEEELVRLSNTTPAPNNIPVSILHSIFVKGELMNFELGEDDIEASRLYPDLEYTTIDQLLDIFLVNHPKPTIAAFE